MKESAFRGLQNSNVIF